MNTKAVSVVMATFNGALYLEEQLNSILSQTLRPVEIIITDDRSTDGTSAILEEYSKQYAPLIRYFINEKRLGVIGNFKKAVSLAGQTDYIALADQDDNWMPDKLSLLCQKIAAIDDGKKPAIVYSDVMVIDSKGNMLNRSFWNELGHDTYEHCFETLLFGNFVTGCSVMMNRQMRSYFALMPSDVLMHDAWLALIAFSFGSVGVIREPLVQYRRHDNNLAFSKTYRKKNKFERLVQHFWRLLRKNDYLAEQFKLIQLFYDAYSGMLTKEQARLITVFLSLRGKPYWCKRIAFSNFFKHHRIR